MGYLKETKINFNKIRDLINAAESLQNAGKDKECSDIIKVLHDELSKM